MKITECLLCYNYLHVNVLYHYYKKTEQLPSMSSKGKQENNLFWPFEIDESRNSKSLQVIQDISLGKSNLLHAEGQNHVVTVSSISVLCRTHRLSN